MVGWVVELQRKGLAGVPSSWRKEKKEEEEKEEEEKGLPTKFPLMRYTPIPSIGSPSCSSNPYHRTVPPSCLTRSNSLFVYVKRVVRGGGRKGAIHPLTHPPTLLT